MRFISNGDYGFPFEASFYWIKYFFIWSFQNGAPNPDGIIRIPSALLNALVFQVFGNVAAAYFYLLLVFVVCFISFYIFARSFIGVQNKTIAAMGALLFTVNPIFLGNAAKIGLTLAVAMLPLLLVCIKNAFDTGKFRYLVIALLLVNISLVHPFTCAVNVLFAAGYVVHRMWQSRRQKVFSFRRIAILAIAAVGINLYFILPIMNIGTVSKDVLSQDVNATKTDYTDLVDIANTGDMLTSLQQARSVLKDVEFFNSTYQPTFVFAVFTLYIIIFGIYIYSRSRWSGQDQRRFLISSSGFLLLTLLATGTFLNIDRVIKFMIGLPGGWMFRSPLKWQLYIPIFLCAALIIALKNIRDKKYQQYAVAGVLGVFVLLNSYIGAEIYRKMLIPRTVDNFAALQTTDLKDKSLLYVNSYDCNDYARSRPELLTELRQVVKSQNVQFKTTNLEMLDATKVSDFDYVMGCKDDVAKAVEGLPFAQKNLVSNQIATYQNKKPTPYMYTTSTVYSAETLTNVNAKQQFTTGRLGNDFTYVARDLHAQKTQSFDQVFEDVKRSDIKDGAIVKRIGPSESERHLYTAGLPFQYKENGKEATISVPEVHTMQAVDQKITVAPRVESFSYIDKQFDYKNVLPNGSLEDGLWRKKVGDCSAYDRNARINMKANTQDKTDGKQSLELSTSGHIACTGPRALQVKPGERYLVSFDYKNVNQTDAAGYNIGFNDTAETSESERLRFAKKQAGWQTVDTTVVVPEGADQLLLTLYGYPDATSSATSIALYDNISVIKVPDVDNNFYLVEDARNIKKAPALTFSAGNPTHKTATVYNAKSPFYLVMKDGYSDRWVASVDGGSMSAGLAKGHVRLNTAMNGWYIDPAELCANGGCHKASDGSYTFTLSIDYTPQKWFVIGAALSFIAWTLCIAYIVRDWRQDKRSGNEKG